MIVLNNQLEKIAKEKEKKESLTKWTSFTCDLKGLRTLKVESRVKI